MLPFTTNAESAPASTKWASHQSLIGVNSQRVTGGDGYVWIKEKIRELYVFIVLVVFLFSKYGIFQCSMLNVQSSNVQCPTFKVQMFDAVVSMAEKEDYILFYFIFNGLNWRAMRSRVMRQKGVSMI